MVVQLPGIQSSRLLFDFVEHTAENSRLVFQDVIPDPGQDSGIINRKVGYFSSDFSHV